MIGDPGVLPFRQTGHGVIVIGGMNFLVVAPEPQEADEYNGCDAANAP
jgi:hypothetical protein